MLKVSYGELPTQDSPQRFFIAMAWIRGWGVFIVVGAQGGGAKAQRGGVLGMPSWLLLLRLKSRILSQQLVTTTLYSIISFREKIKINF